VKQATCVCKKKGEKKCGPDCCTKTERCCEGSGGGDCCKNDEDCCDGKCCPSDQVCCGGDVCCDPKKGQFCLWKKGQAQICKKGCTKENKCGAHCCGTGFVCSPRTTTCVLEV
jgi:hypothetical protein